MILDEKENEISDNEIEDCTYAWHPTALTNYYSKSALL